MLLSPRAPGLQPQVGSHPPPRRPLLAATQMPAWGQTRDGHCDQDKEGAVESWAVQGGPGGEPGSLPREAAGEGADSTEMLMDVPHRPLGAALTYPHRPCPQSPKPSQASASSHLPGLLAEPVDPYAWGQQQVPVPGQTAQGRLRAALDTCSPRRGSTVGHHGGARPRQSGHCPASVRLTWANTHTRPLQLWKQLLKLPSSHFLISERRKCLS